MVSADSSRLREASRARLDQEKQHGRAPQRLLRTHVDAATLTPGMTFVNTNARTLTLPIVGQPKAIRLRRRD